MIACDVAAVLDLRVDARAAWRASRGRPRSSFARRTSPPFRFRSNAPASAPFGKRAFVSAVVTSFERSRPSFFSIGTRRRTSFFSGLSKRWTETTLTFARLDDLADLVLVGVLREAVDDLRAAREVDAEVRAALEDERDRADDDREDRQRDADPLDLQEVDVGVVEETHVRSSRVQMEIVSTRSFDP